MSPEKQFETIVNGNVQAAVREYLDGDWSRLPMLFTVSRSVFNAWADSVELPYGCISRKWSAHDGIYVLPDPEGWMVFEQQRGIRLSGARIFPDYKQAKRAALTAAYQAALRGAR